MKKQHFFYVFCLLMLFSFKSKKKDKAIISGEIWLDNNSVYINAHGGGILYDHEKYYWFGEHKTKGADGNVANVGVHCYSSKDLYKWKDEGIVLKVAPAGSGSDIEKGCILERPKVIRNKKTGKYVMWFHLEKKNNGYTDALNGVAVSSKITGPYTYLKSVRPNSCNLPINVLEIHKKESPAVNYKFNGWSLPGNVDTLNILGRDLQRGQMSRDMTLFVDDDEKAFHIYSSEENSTLHIAELTDDYLSHTGKYIRCFGGRFMEAPAMFKRNGKYYLMMSGCSSWAPNEARSAVADSIFGNWKELGNPCVGEQSKTSFKSQSCFIFPVQSKKDAFIYMGDRWTPENAIDGKYIWLPITFANDRFFIEWNDKWSLEEFK